MFRFIVLSSLLTMLWIWLFWKLVIEDGDLHLAIQGEFDILNTLRRQEALRRVARNNQIRHNILVLVWFGTFTYLMSNIWRIWVNRLFGLGPDNPGEAGFNEADIGNIPAFHVDEANDHGEISEDLSESSDDESSVEETENVEDEKSEHSDDTNDSSTYQNSETGDFSETDTIVGSRHS